MKKLILGATALMLLFASCETEPIGQDDLKGVEAKAKIAQSKANNASATLSFEGENAPCAPIQEAELYAGQFNLVGKVTVELSEDETEYTITYSVNPGFCISETHLSVVDMLTSFPMASGNPVPGQFEYKGEHDCESGVSYTVPNTGPYIAAHAVVNCVEISAPLLPEVADFCIEAQGVNASGTYFDVSVDGEGLIGAFGAWCVDVDLGIGAECIEDALVYSSMDFPEELFENPQDMPAVVWLLNNQDLIGTESAGKGGIYNFGDFQNAIWLLIDDEGTRTGQNLGDYDPDLERANELKVMALAAVEGVYEPGCGDFIAAILVPVDENRIPNKQAIIIPVPVNCKEACSETAWARNSFATDCGNFPGNNWATYFVYGAND